MSSYLVMAGGTGGHIFPALAVAQKLQGMGHRVIWLGSKNSMEDYLIRQYNIELQTIAIKGIRGNGLIRKLFLPVTLFKTIIKVKKIIKRNNIKGAIGFGGFVSFPGGVAAKFSRIPLVIHEQNAIAGLSNKILAKLANQVFYAVPDTFKNSEGLIGNPVRSVIVALLPPEQRFSARVGRLKLLVIGGSKGAKVLNETIPVILSLIPEAKRPLVRHQCGRGYLEQTQTLYQALKVKVEVLEFMDDIADEYSMADFVVCRSGALTVSELAIAGLGGYLIPFPFAVDDHQTYNASYLVKHHAAVCIAQYNLSPEEMAKNITELTREQCLIWAKNAKQLAMLGADQKIVDKMIAYSRAD